MKTGWWLLSASTSGCMASARLTAKSTTALFGTPYSATSSISFDTASTISTTACVTGEWAASQSSARRAESWTSILVNRNSTSASLASASNPGTGTAGTATRGTDNYPLVERRRPRRRVAASSARSDAFSALRSWGRDPSSGGAAGLEMGATDPTASEYFKYVSIEATTMRASTVMRSIPTSDTRTHASMTIPLSSTRSRTSMRLVPPGARSTAMLLLLAQLTRFTVVGEICHAWP